jgi:hypothetical protein
MLSAGNVGLRRHVSALVRRYEHRHRSGIVDAWKQHIEGAIGEYAAAKMLGVKWGGHVDVYNVPDLTYHGHPVQIRTQVTENETGRLIVKPSDPDDWICMLVLGVAPRYTLAGWIKADVAKCRYDLTKREGDAGWNPVYFVPSEELMKTDVPQKGAVKEEIPF